MEEKEKVCNDGWDEISEDRCWVCHNEAGTCPYTDGDYDDEEDE